MSKNYNRKKHITIVMLSVLAVCLAGGLAWYTGLIGKPVAEQETLAAVPETDAGGTVEQEAEPEETTEATGEEETAEKDAGEGIEEAGKEPEKELEWKEDEAEPGKTSAGQQGTEKAPVTSGVQPSHTEDARTQTEVMSSEPSAENGSGAEAEKTAREADNQPQGAETVPEGMVYVPGFGYIESSGPNHQETSRADGDWDRQIGTMQ